ncbi:MAG: hypothetical protein AAF196_03185 [Planctomycetota bacterium]
MTPSSILSVGIAVLAIAGSASAQEPDEKRVTRLLPAQLDWPNAPAIRVPYPPFLQLSRAALESDFDDPSGPMFVREDYVSIELDALVEVLDHRFEIFDRDGEIGGSGDLIAVTGPESMVDDVSRSLAVLQDLVRPSIDVRVELWTVGDDLDQAVLPTVLSPAEFQGLQLRGNLLWSSATTTGFSQLMRFSALESKPFVHDHEVEVAKEARAGDPRVRSLICGASARIEIEPAVAGDGLVLFGDVSFSRGELGDRFYSLGLDEVGVLDAPRLRSSRATVSARIENGGAMAIWSLGRSGHSPNFVMTVTANRPAVPSLDGLQVVPISSLRSGRLTEIAVSRPSSERRFVGEFDFGEEQESVTWAATEATLESFYSGLDEEAWMVDAGGFLFVEDQSPLPGRFRQLEADLHRNVQVDFVTLADARGSFGGQDQAPASIWDRLVVPCLSSRVSIVSRGTEATEVFDYDVEIAEDSKAMNPNVQGVFSGFIGTVRLMPEFGGRVRASIIVDLMEAGEPRRQPVGGKDSGDLWLHDVVQAPCLWAGRLDLPRTIETGDAFDFQRDGARTRLRSRVTFR